MLLARIDRRLEAVGLKQHAASQLAGKPDSIRNLRRGKTQEMSPATLRALAPILKTTVEWLMQGTGPEDIEPEPHELINGKPGVPLKGYVTAGRPVHYYPVPDEELDLVAAPDDAMPRTVAVRIRGTSMGAMLDGALVYYDDVRSPVTDDLFGRVCVVGLADGSVMLKRLMRGSSPDRYTLLSDEEPMRDVEVEWAAPIRSMVLR